MIAANDLTTLELEVEHLRIYVRDAAITLVPHPSEEEIERVAATVRQSYPAVLIERLSEHSILVEGIPVRADSPHDADVVTWERIAVRAHAALGLLEHTTTRLASIDVRPACGLEAMTPAR